MVRFSEPWDKLHKDNRRPGGVFTTCRGYEPKKETYYNGMIGKEDEVWLNEKVIGTAVLMAVWVARPSEMGLEFMQRDTYGYFTMSDIFKTMRKFYCNPDPVCLILRYKWSTVKEE